MKPKKIFQICKERIKKINRRFNLLHNGFRIGILLKGIDALLEIVGGILLLFITPARMNLIIAALTRHELSGDPHDLVANFLVNSAHNFSISSQHFGIFYLTSHGLIKLFLVIFLLKKKQWAYPAAIVFLLLFVVYQAYRYAVTGSAWMIMLSVFDTAVIFLTFAEYRRIRLKNK
jgi:uncharacterized membrane protein